MVRQPELLLLDEPATGVDPDAKIELYRMLRDINRELGVTIVMVSHDLELAAEVALMLCALTTMSASGATYSRRWCIVISTVTFTDRRYLYVGNV